MFGVPGDTIKTPFGYCIGGFAFGSDVSAAPAYNPSPWPTVAGTLGGPGSTDLDFQRVKVAAPGKGGKQYIIQNNNWGTPSGTDQTIMYSGNTFTIMSTTGNVTGQGVPASFPSIYVGNNGDTQSKNDPPKGSYTTKPADNLPKSISSIGTAMTTAAYNKNSGDFNATYDIWLASARRPPRTATRSDGFVMVWLYKPGSRSPIGSMKTSKSIGGSMYNVWAGPRNSGTNPNRPVISYVLQGGSMNKSFDLKPILADAAANATTYGVGAIQHELAGDGHLLRLRDLDRQRRVRPRRHQLQRRRPVGGRPWRCAGVSGLAAAGLLLAAGCSSKSGGTTTTSVCPVMDDLISDFNTDNGVYPVDGRPAVGTRTATNRAAGRWYPAEGGSATPDLETGNPNCPGASGRCTSSRWGSRTGARRWASTSSKKVDTDAGVAKGTYDASKYKGIAFGRGRRRRSRSCRCRSSIRTPRSRPSCR